MTHYEAAETLDQLKEGLDDLIGLDKSMKEAFEMAVNALYAKGKIDEYEGEKGIMLIDGNRLMMSLADWWYSSFGEEETEEAKAIRSVMNKVEESLEKFKVDFDFIHAEGIRCKDCKWYDERIPYCNNDNGLVECFDTDFCSYAERKEQRQEDRMG